MTATTDTTDTIRRTATGSIDTAYYIARSHNIRSQAAHNILGRIGGALKRLLSRITSAQPMNHIPSPRPMMRPVRNGRRFRSDWREADDTLCMTFLSHPENARKAR